MAIIFILKKIKMVVIIMNRLRNFMNGRYGIDQYSIGLLVISAIIFAIVRILPRFLGFLSILGYIPIAIYMYRALSKDIYKRQQENYKFIQLKNSLLMNLSKAKNKLKDIKSFKYFNCPQCSQKLRVPRKQGKITITCPKCKNIFKGKS